jgi:hypothetical protein
MIGPCKEECDVYCAVGSLQKKLFSLTLVLQNLLFANVPKPLEDAWVKFPNTTHDKRTLNF